MPPLKLLQKQGKMQLDKKPAVGDKFLAYVLLGVIAIISFSATGYAFYSRRPEDFLSSIPILLAVYAIFAIKLLIDKKIDVSALVFSKFNYFGLGYVFPLLGAALISFGLYASAYDSIHYLTKVDSVYQVAIVALFVGVVLFFVRLHVRFWYGAVEVFLGVFVAMSVYQANATKPATSLFLTVLTAGVYLIVRGLDNMHQGWSTDKLNKFIGERLTSQATKQREEAERVAADQKRKAEEALKAKQKADEAAKQKKRQDEALAKKARRREAARKAIIVADTKDTDANTDISTPFLEAGGYMHKHGARRIIVNVNAVDEATQTHRPLGKIAQEIAKTATVKNSSQFNAGEHLKALLLKDEPSPKLLGEQEARNSAYSIAKQTELNLINSEENKRAGVVIMREPHLNNSAKQVLDELEAKNKLFESYKDFMDRDRR
jgi:hypothetical protein